MNPLEDYNEYTAERGIERDRIDASCAQGAADERARCIKVLVEYRDALMESIPATPSERRAVTLAIDVLRESNGSVGSSPVGGEQHG